MSGRGDIDHRRPLRMTAEAAEEFEREAAVEHVRGKIAFLRQGAMRHRMEGADLDHTVRVLDELADELDRGMHRKEPSPGKGGDR